MRVLVWLQSVIAGLMAVRVGRGRNDLDKLVASYQRLNDAELIAEYEREAERLAVEPEVGFLRALKRYRNTTEAAIMAISVVAFDRRPADLRTGSAAYEEQIEAAQLLVDQVNVQMETGEGKTYAIALALPTIVARHRQAWVVTVNDYLAARDAERVRPYLEFLGIEVQTGLPAADYRGVSYMQFSSAAFGYLDRTYGDPTLLREDYPNWAGVILDEIDSILIDGDVNFVSLEHLDAEESSWPEVSRSVANWAEGLQFTFERVRDTVSLTPAGWREVQALALVIGLPAQRVQDMAEATAWALFAEEGREYILDGEAIQLINPVTGALSGSDSSVRVKALRYRLTGKPAWAHRTFANISSLDILGKHPHVVGLSGTAAADLLYYQIVLRTWTLAVPPRFARRQENLATRFFRARSESLASITAEISNRQSPTVIIAWSVGEATATAQYIRARFPDRTVNVITAFDSETSNNIIEQAGEPGVITVMSSGGCRGIDIRSTHSPHLVVLGHGREPRLDRQVLGRVGRHGEQYTAEFIEDADTPLVRSTPALQSALRLAGTVTEGELQLSRQVGWQFRRLQSAWWRQTMARRSLSGALAVSARQAEELFSARFVALRNAARANDVVAYVLALEARPEPREAALAAMERRSANDSATRSFVETVRSLAPSFGLREPVRLKAEATASDAPLMAEIVRWAGSFDAQAASGTEAAMRRQQLTTMSGLTFRLPSLPEVRTPIQASYAVLKASSVSYLAEVEQEENRIAVNFSGATYYRKCAVLFITHAMRFTDSVAQETLEALQSIDRPSQIAYLFPSTVYYRRDPDRQKSTREKPATATARPQSIPELDSELINQIIDSIARDLEPGLFGVGPSKREISLYLHALISTLGRRLPFMTSAQVERDLDLELQRQIAEGYRTLECNVLYRAGTRLVNQLALHGVGSVRVREGAPTLLARTKARLRLARTISPLYLLTLVLFFSLAIAGVLIPTPHAPEWLVGVGDVLGLGWIGATPASIASAVLGTLVIADLVADAIPVIDKQVALPAIGPFVAAVVASWGSFTTAGAGAAALLGLVALVWTRILLILCRFTLQGSAVDPLHLLAALSVVVFLGSRLLEGFDLRTVYLVPWLIAGMALVSVFISIPIGRSERSTDGNATLYHQVLSSLRLAIDPTFVSAFSAFIATALLLPWLSELGNVAFAGAQIAIFVGILLFRTRISNVQRILARRKYAQIGNESETKFDLNRRLRRTLIWVAPIGAGYVLLAALAQLSSGAMMLAEMAGFVLLVGFREVAGIIGGGQSSRFSSDAGLLREERARVWQQLKALIKKPSGKVGAVVLAVTITWNLLSFTMNLWSLPQFFHAIWNWLSGGH